MTSLANYLASLPEAKKREILEKLSPEELEHLKYRWDFWGRPEQIAPRGDWYTWLVLAGRGYGKTRAGSEWVKSIVCGVTPHSAGGASRIALIAETAADARDVMVEGDSGILSVHHKDFRPVYEPSKRRLTWPNGAVATLFNATEPDQLRGPQFDAALLDELAKWRYAKETYDMLQFGLRLGDHPKQMITTTPRPIPVLKEIMKDGSTVVTRGSTFDNVANLAPSFIKQIKAKYEGTRLGRQELEAEILDDMPGALWTRASLEENRKKTDDLPDMQRIVVGVDPAASDTNAEGVAETGIVVAGLGVDNRGYILDDKSCKLGPLGWARRSIAAYHEYDADSIVVEINQGGAMVASTIRSVNPDIPITEVRATRGKVVRAEPIASLYEQNRISHTGNLSALEDQMVVFTSDGPGSGQLVDRVDALVWALTQLFPSIIQKESSDFDFNDQFANSGAGGWLNA